MVATGKVESTPSRPSTLIMLICESGVTQLQSESHLHFTPAMSGIVLTLSSATPGWPSHKTFPFPIAEEEALEPPSLTPHSWQLALLATLHCAFLPKPREQGSNPLEPACPSHEGLFLCFLMGLELPSSEVCLPESLLSLGHFLKGAKTAAGMGSGSLKRATAGQSSWLPAIVAVRTGLQGLYLPQGNSVQLARLSAEVCLGAAARLHSKVAAFLSPDSFAFAEVLPTAVCGPSVGWLTCLSQLPTSLLWRTCFHTGNLHLPPPRARECSAALGFLWGRKHRQAQVRMLSQAVPWSSDLSSASVGFCLHSPFSSKGFATRPVKAAFPQEQTESPTSSVASLTWAPAQLLWNTTELVGPSKAVIHLESSPGCAVGSGPRAQEESLRPGASADSITRLTVPILLKRKEWQHFLHQEDTRKKCFPVLELLRWAVHPVVPVTWCYPMQWGQVLLRILCRIRMGHNVVITIRSLLLHKVSHFQQKIFWKLYSSIPDNFKHSRNSRIVVSSSTASKDGKFFQNFVFSCSQLFPESRSVITCRKKKLLYFIGFELRLIYVAFG